MSIETSSDKNTIPVNLLLDSNRKSTRTGATELGHSKSGEPTGPATLNWIPHIYQNEMTENCWEKLPNDYNLNKIQRFRIRRGSNY